MLLTAVLWYARNITLGNLLSVTQSVTRPEDTDARGRFSWPVAVAGYRWQHYPPAPEPINSELVEVDPSRGRRLTHPLEPLEAKTALFRELASLQVQPDESDDPAGREEILVFANRWGLLLDPDGQADYGTWEEHVEVLAYAVQMFDALRENDTATLRDWLTGAYWLHHHVPWKTHASKIPTGHGDDDDDPPDGTTVDGLGHWYSLEQRHTRFLHRVDVEQARLATWSDQAIVREARRCLLHKEIAAWLDLYSMTVIIDDDDAQPGRIDQVPTCLYGAAWRQLTDAVLGQRQFRQCEQCPRWFEVAPDVARVDKRYCGDACRAAAYRRRGTPRRPRVQ